MNAETRPAVQLSGIELIRQRARERGSGYAFCRTDILWAREVLKDPATSQEERMRWQETLCAFSLLPQPDRRAVMREEQTIHVDIRGNLIRTDLKRLK